MRIAVCFLHRTASPGVEAAGQRPDTGAARLASRGMDALSEVNRHDRFILRQRIRPVVNQYEFMLPGPDGEPGPPFCFVQQRRFAFKEDIRFYADDSKQQELMRIKARQAFDPSARYEVTDAAGQRVGEIQKVFGASLLRSTYVMYDAYNNEAARATEKSLGVALGRRVVDLVPYVGAFGDWL